MKLSEKWLREWVSPKIDTKELATRLTMAGLEVGALEPAAPEPKSVVVGEIVSVEPHPSAEHLTCCRVNIGKTKPLSVVCGAANVIVGMKAPMALPGAKLAGDKIIEKTKIRGVTSDGMLCSGEDLGLEETSIGLYPLDDEAKPGTTLTGYLALPDTILEIDLTPNRGDCLSVAGVARELAALTGSKIKAPKLSRIPVRNKRRLSVKLNASRECPHYVGRVIEGINSEAVTPIWMRERLRRSGVRTLHPLVDVTNYVMLELGQPMHAFDLDKLNGAIQVRLSARGERITLLDGNEIELEPGELLIADGNGPLALAGIMGGQTTAVDQNTSRVFLESAYFRPQSISSRARAMGLLTESSYRFERGVDPSLQKRAIEHATALLLDIVGGTAGPLIEKIAKRHLPKPPSVRLHRNRLNRLLGLTLPANRVEIILKRLGMRSTKVTGGWRITPPSYRFDIESEADLIEEVARIHGYETIPGRLPDIPMPVPAQSESFVTESRLCHTLVDRDYQEVITYSFVDPVILNLIDPQTDPVKLANPISADMGVMRTTLWPGLLQTVTYNQNHQQSRMRLFEIGRRFIPKGKSATEQKVLAAAACGTAMVEQWGAHARPVDYYNVKGDLEALLDLTGGSHAFRFEPTAHPALHPGQSAVIRHIDEGIIGLIGVLHPSIQATLELAQSVILFEVDFSIITRAKVPKFKEISKYPAIRRDLDVVVTVDIPAQAVSDCVVKVAGNLLVNLELFDVYRGEGIDSGRKSLTLGLTLQHSSRTLKEGEIETLITRVIAALGSDLQAELRR